MTLRQIAWFLTAYVALAALAVYSRSRARAQIASNQALWITAPCEPGRGNTPRPLS